MLRLIVMLQLGALAHVLNDTFLIYGLSYSVHLMQVIILDGNIKFDN